MNVFAQGILGQMDTFIHANYVSSVEPSYGSSFALAVVGLAIGSILFAVGLYVYIHFRAVRRRKERGGPQGGRDGPS